MWRENHARSYGEHFDQSEDRWSQRHGSVNEIEEPCPRIPFSGAVRTKDTACVTMQGVPQATLSQDWLLTELQLGTRRRLAAAQDEPPLGGATLSSAPRQASIAHLWTLS